MLTSPAFAEAQRFYVPPQQFNAAFQVMNLGFANVFGLFQNATGSFFFDPDTKTISKVRIALDTSSLMTASPEVRQDLTSLLDPRRYPELSFMATAPVAFKDGKAEIKGTLSAHGASKPFTFMATLNHVGKTPNGGGFWGGEGQAVGLSLNGDLKRADFGMGDPPEEPGRFGEALSLRLEMQALEQ